LVFLGAGVLTFAVLFADRVWGNPKPEDFEAKSQPSNAKSTEAKQPATAELRTVPPGQEDTYWAYYELQFERVAAFESYRLQVSNFVLAGSVVAIGLLATPSGKNADTRVAFVVCLALLLVNLLAMIFSANARRWVKVHQMRAKEALDVLSPGLASIKRDVDRRFGLADSDNRNSWFRSNMLTSYMHAVIALSAAALFALSI
jgi:hypothetical protein